MSTVPVLTIDYVPGRKIVETICAESTFSVISAEWSSSPSVIRSRYSSFINGMIDSFAGSAEQYGDDVAVVGLTVNVGVDSLGLTFVVLTGTIVKLGD